MHFALAALFDVVDYLNAPVVMHVTNSRVAVTRYFVVELRYRSRNVMRMQISCGWTVLQANDVAVAEVADFIVEVQRRLIPAGMDDPFVVVVFVVVTSDLLLR